MTEWLLIVSNSSSWQLFILINLVLFLSNKTTPAAATTTKLSHKKAFTRFPSVKKTTFFLLLLSFPWCTVTSTDHQSALRTCHRHCHHHHCVAVKSSSSPPLPLPFPPFRAIFFVFEWPKFLNNFSYLQAQSSTAQHSSSGVSTPLVPAVTAAGRAVFTQHRVDNYRLTGNFISFIHLQQSQTQGWSGKTHRLQKQLFSYFHHHHHPQRVDYFALECKYKSAVAHYSPSLHITTTFLFEALSSWRNTTALSPLGCRLSSFFFFFFCMVIIIIHFSGRTTTPLYRQQIMATLWRLQLTD